jgi:hypothetical protein
LQLSQPILTSINYQPGDLVLSDKRNSRCCENKVLQLMGRASFNKLYPVMRPDNAQICRCYELEQISMVFFGIPNPRVKVDIKTFIENEKFIKLLPYPSFHNTVIDITSRARDSIRIFMRREEISNVSNLFSR